MAMYVHGDLIRSLVHYSLQIQRVLCRFLAVHADMKKKSTLAHIWEIAEESMPDERAGHWK
jgi:adenine-specific DNA glycosylase